MLHACVRRAARTVDSTVNARLSSRGVDLAFLSGKLVTSKCLRNGRSSRALRAA